MSNSKINKKIDIAVIDSGALTEKYDLKKYIKKSTGFSLEKDGKVVEEKNKPIKHIHGTLVSLIIKNICPDVNIYSINILNDFLKSDGRVLIYSIRKALELKPDIINLSLGTKSWRYWFSFRRIINNAKKQNVIIVAAADNDGDIAFPANMRGVVGVKSSSKVHPKKGFFLKKYYEIKCSYDCIKYENNPEFRNFLKCNSAAAAYLTGYIANHLLNKERYKSLYQEIMNPDLNEIIIGNIS